MTDREMLELAAKAVEWQLCGYSWIGENEDDDECETFEAAFVKHNPEQELATMWNPLTDDGDALRLAVTLLINVEPYEDYIFVESYSGPFANEFIKQNKGCRFLAARRAIVRVAAQIGKEME